MKIYFCYNLKKNFSKNVKSHHGLTRQNFDYNFMVNFGANS
jgi:hypothetical protein